MEVGCGRADDHYLVEGAGFARRSTANKGHVRELAPLTGDGYEAWVAGRDPETLRIVALVLEDLATAPCEYSA